MKSRKFLCCLPLTFGVYFIAIVNLVEIKLGCATAVHLLTYLQSDLVAIGILILVGIVSLFWALMNLFFLASIRRSDPHGVVDYLNLMLMISVFEFVLVIAEAIYVSRFLWKGREVPHSMTTILIPPIAFIVQIYFTYIVELFYQKCEHEKEEERERIAVNAPESSAHAYENQVTLKRIVTGSNGRVLLETDV